jgi:hypothetical protein
MGQFHFFGRDTWDIAETAIFLIQNITQSIANIEIYIYLTFLITYQSIDKKKSKINSNLIQRIKTLKIKFSFKEKKNTS